MYEIRSHFQSFNFSTNCIIFRFDVDRDDVNYIAVSSNIALEGSNGGPEKYELYMKYGSVPSPTDYDLKSSLTASDSYVGTVLYRYNNILICIIGKHYER